MIKGSCIIMTSFNIMNGLNAHGNKIIPYAKWHLFVVCLYYWQLYIVNEFPNSHIFVKCISTIINDDLKILKLKKEDLEMNAEWVGLCYGI